eukprot:13746366-Alexandrium_andersonii.AAC.1
MTNAQLDVLAVLGPNRLSPLATQSPGRPNQNIARKRGRMAGRQMRSTSSCVRRLPARQT